MAKCGGKGQVTQTAAATEHEGDGDGDVRGHHKPDAAVVRGQTDPRLPIGLVEKEPH